MWGFGGLRANRSQSRPPGVQQDDAHSSPQAVPKQRLPQRPKHKHRNARDAEDRRVVPPMHESCTWTQPQMPLICWGLSLVSPYGGRRCGRGGRIPRLAPKVSRRRRGGDWWRRGRSGEGRLDGTGVHADAVDGVADVGGPHGPARAGEFSQTLAWPVASRGERCGVGVESAGDGATGAALGVVQPAVPGVAVGDGTPGEPQPSTTQVPDQPGRRQGPVESRLAQRGRNNLHPDQGSRRQTRLSATSLSYSPEHGLKARRTLSRCHTDRLTLNG